MGVLRIGRFARLFYDLICEFWDILEMAIEVEIIRNLTDTVDSLVGAAALLFSAVFAGFIVIQIGFQKKSVKMQDEQLQASIKSNSATIIREFSKETYDDEIIIANLTSLKNNPKEMSFAGDEQELNRFLDHFEGLAIYWKDKIVTNFHTIEYYGADLINMHNCPTIMDRLNITINEHPYPKFNRLHELIIYNHDQWAVND